MRCKPKVLDTKHRPICFRLLPVFKLEFLSLLSTLIVFCLVFFLRGPVLPRPLFFCFPPALRPSPAAPSGLPPQPFFPLACFFLPPPFSYPFASLSLHCCFRCSAIFDCFLSCLHWLRAAAVDALRGTRSRLCGRGSQPLFYGSWCCMTCGYLTA